MQENEICHKTGNDDKPAISVAATVVGIDIKATTMLLVQRLTAHFEVDTAVTLIVLQWKASKCLKPPNGSSQCTV